MKISLLFILLVCAVNESMAQLHKKDIQVPSNLDTIINAIKKNYAPDHRTAVFQVSAIKARPLTLEVSTTDSLAFVALKKVLPDSVIPVLEMLPSPALGNRHYAITTLSVSNHRVAPDFAAEMVTQSLMGTKLDLLKKEQGYYLARTPDGYISYVENAGIVPMDSLELIQWFSAPKMVFTDRYGIAYSEPSVKSQPVCDLVAGDILVSVGHKKKFQQVRFANGKTAFVPKKALTDYEAWLSRPNPDAASVIATGKTLVGVPYLWGGTSIKGMDCSGFVKTSFYLNGIVLPRDASQQALAGEALDIYDHDTVSIQKCVEKLLPGDLLFFGRKRPDGSNHVVHVAIYTGNGGFIQSSGFVQQSSLLPEASDYDPWNAHRLLSARRVLTQIGTSGISRIDKNAYYR